MATTDPKTQFRINRVKQLKDLYSDDQSTKRRYDQTQGYSTQTYKNAKELRDAMWKNISQPASLVELSKKLYAVNPIYSSIINYMSDMFYWRYKITPHKVYSKSKAKLRKQKKDDDFELMYNLMLEVVDGLSIETKFPALLTLNYLSGAVYWTTICDEESITIDTILLPTKYCRKIGETQYGTAIIEFDFSYFNDLSLSRDDLGEYLKSFPKEFQKKYNKYASDNNLRWQELDPHFSSGMMLNDVGMPTYLYLYGGILDYEKYQDNELERNENLLRYIVVHTMPHYEDKLIFEVDEVKSIHQSLKKIIDTGDRARLVTTYGDIHIEQVGESDRSENEVLSKAYKAIFNNAGFNNSIFTSESVTALKLSLIRDKSLVWRYVQILLNFYSIAINNWFDFKDYQADIDILPISPYTYDDDIKIYKDNATLGVGKLDYIIATGIKQKNIKDQLYLEDFLKLNDITPMQTSYTQTADDRQEESKEEEDNKSPKEVTPGNEPPKSNEEVEEDK